MAKAKDIFRVLWSYISHASTLWSLLPPSIQEFFRPYVIQTGVALVSTAVFGVWFYFYQLPTPVSVLLALLAFAIVFNIVNQFKLTKQLQLQESTFIPSSSMVEPNLPEATSIQLSRDYIQGVRLYLPDLTRDLTAVIKNKHFDRCVIYGPAIISPISSCHIESNQFAYSGGNSSDLFHEISDERKEIIGIIGLIDCKFTNCWFRGVALAGNIHLRNQFETGKHLPPVSS